MLENKNKGLVYTEYELENRNLLKDKMCKAVYDMLDETEFRTRLKVLREIMENCDFTAQQAVELLDISDEERIIYMERL